jgi:hypothetical protein
LFGLRHRTTSGTKQRQSYSKTGDWKEQETQTKAKRKKRIKKDEGEYVDYEEI